MTFYKNFPGAIILLSLPILYACNHDPKTSEAASLQEPNIQTTEVQLVRNDAERKVDVLIDGEHFTSYIYPEDIAKPVLYPIKTASGTLITRGFPLESRAGERIDHPHHIGLWLNYGDVNGLDFWNNSEAIAADKKGKYGSIIHSDILSTENGDEEGKLVTTADWMDNDQNTLLKEETTFVFRGTDSKRIIDRVTRLTAQGQDVSFKDNKEGMLGLRVARELEHPSEKAEKFTDANGIPTDVPSLDNEGVTGMYTGSNGMTGDDVWGTRGEWMNLSGEIKGEKISVAILDHPDNVGYPTYWHARGYGLYAANPLGQKALSEGREELNFELKAGESATFNYRIIIYSGIEVNDEQINADFEKFTGI